jgi:hypothetical protein
MAYGKSAGLYDESIVVDMNSMLGDIQQKVLTALKNADILISAAAFVYLDPPAVEKMIGAFASNTTKPGYVLVNFINLFAAAKADAIKRLLLTHLDFVGSMAARHRLLTEDERKSYPDEEWALLEIWVLKRRD